MCGIAGFIAGHGAANAAALAPMLARIAHRGPDGQGTFVEGPAALGHCRLAIIDLEGGAQPLYSEDKNLVVVFNGEIYNYRALTAELTALGHTFATRTDTEVLLHGWEQWGRELLPRLRGMFAFALWDRRAGVLFCARDMFGIKPLYYCRCADGTLLFASEIKAFLDHPSFAKRLNTAHREVLLHKCAHIFHVSGQILQKLIHPPRAFGIHGFHGNLPHNVSLTVARCRICFPVSFPELLVLVSTSLQLPSVNGV